MLFLNNCLEAITYRREKVISTVFILLLSCYLSSLTISGKVIAVKDGDSIEILNNKHPVEIRLDGIDCPEKGQDFGTKAKLLTSKLCFKKIVKARIKGKDQYNRYLAEVILPNGKILNRELLIAGLAWHYKEYNSDQILANIELKARKVKTGLWSQKNPIPPWDFRKGNSSKNLIKATTNYVGSKKSNKYHYPNCEWAARITPDNLIEFKTKIEAEEINYFPCKVCKP